MDPNEVVQQNLAIAKYIEEQRAAGSKLSDEELENQYLGIPSETFAKTVRVKVDPVAAYIKRERELHPDYKPQYLTEQYLTEEYWGKVWNRRGIAAFVALALSVFAIWAAINLSDRYSDDQKWQQGVAQLSGVNQTDGLVPQSMEGTCLMQVAVEKTMILNAAPYNGGETPALEVLAEAQVQGIMAATHVHELFLVKNAFVGVIEAEDYFGKNKWASIYLFGPDGKPVYSGGALWVDASHLKYDSQSCFF